MRTNVLMEAAAGRCADARCGAVARRAVCGEGDAGGDGSEGVGGDVGESFGATLLKGVGARGGEGGGRTRRRRRPDAQARGAERPLGTERRRVPSRRMRGAGGAMTGRKTGATRTRRGDRRDGAAASADVRGVWAG